MNIIGEYLEIIPRWGSIVVSQFLLLPKITTSVQGYLGWVLSRWEVLFRANFLLC